MRRYHRTFTETIVGIAVIAILSAILFPLLGRRAERPVPLLALPTRYTLTDLGTLGNGGSAIAYDINDAGQVTGYATNSSSQARVFLWENGTMRDMGTLGAGTQSYGIAINNAGQIAGQSNAVPSYVWRAVLWNDGAASDLTTGYDGGVAYSVNDAGQVVGNFNHGRAFLWQNGVLTDLGGLGNAGGGGGFAFDINESGQVVGSSYTDIVLDIGAVQHAFLWQNGVVTDLGVLPGFEESGASGINEAGQIVGTCDITDPSTYEVISRAFLYENGVMTDLGVNSFQSGATDINDSGQVVGYMRASGGFSRDHAFIYEDGVVKDLNSLIPFGSGLTLSVAYAINNAGQIVGYAKDAAGRNHAFLLTPADGTLPSLLYIGDAAVAEGRSGTQAAVFTVTLFAAATVPVTVNYATANGTASAGSDYQAASGTLTFAPGETTKTVSIVVMGDKKREAHETFSVNLSGAKGASIDDGQGIGTIWNDD